MSNADGLDGERVVREWLARQGYPLELRVVSALSAAGFPEVGHSERYIDSDTGKTREIDAAAWDWFFVRDVDEGDDEDIMAQLAIAIECKNNPSRPWVAFGWSAAASGFTGWLPGTNVALNDLIQTAAPNLFRGNIGQDIRPTILTSERHATAIAVAHKSHGNEEEKDPAYSAIMGASKAALYLGQEYEYAMALPVVVIAAPLFFCCLAENQEVDVIPIDRCYVAPHLIEGPGVFVVREEVFPEFLNEVRETFSLLDRVVSDCRRRERGGP